ncbi:hypothetical protein WMF11_43305 [Sorangium sp. So ce295]|jgi:hypothetical protein
MLVLNHAWLDVLGKTGTMTSDSSILPDGRRAHPGAPGKDEERASFHSDI